MSTGSVFTGRAGGSGMGPAMVPEFVAYLTGGMAERYGVPTHLSGEPMRGGAAEAYRGAWIAHTHVCVFCRVGVAQEAALAWTQQFEAQLAIETELAERGAAAAAVEKAEADQRDVAERQRVSVAHRAHLMTVPPGTPAEADLLSERDRIVQEARAVRRAGREAAHDRRRIERGPALTDVVLRLVARGAAMQIASVVLALLVLPDTVGWGVLTLLIITALLSWALSTLMRRYLRERIGEDPRVIGEIAPSGVGSVLTVVGAVIVALLTARWLLRGVSFWIALTLVLVAEAVIAVVAAAPAVTRQAELDGAIAEEKRAIAVLRGEHEEVERQLALYRCGVPGCTDDNRVAITG